MEPSSTLSILSTNPQKELTFDRILKEAKGIYVEIYILNKKPLHGTILEILDDYIVFYSPIYKKIYCPKDHLKWLIPYSTTERPYNLSASEYNWLHVEKGFEKNLNLQLKKSLNKLIVINFGEKTHHIGKIISINDKMLELRTVKEESVYVNIEHVQTISEV